MNAQKLHDMLGRLSGHLITDTHQKETEIHQLHASLSRSLLPDDLQQLKSSHFIFENSDLFAAEQIPTDRSDVLRSIADTAVCRGRANRNCVCLCARCRCAIVCCMPPSLNGAAGRRWIIPLARSPTKMDASSGLISSGSKNWWHCTSRASAIRCCCLTCVPAWS